MTSSERTPLIAEARKRYHQRLIEDGTLSIDKEGNPSNADKHSASSVKIARGVSELLELTTSAKLSGQSAGKHFEDHTALFVEEVFMALPHLRPGNWIIKTVGGRNRSCIADFEQYAHLTVLEEAAKYNVELKAALGNDYIITPDIIIVRNLATDSEINARVPLVDENVSKRASLRKSNGGRPLLHASISTKWTIRSDRSQNSRTEAQNLIRNRKGRVPHMVVVTGEPLPARLASIALGTGDIDCVYHFALDELIKAVSDHGDETSKELIGTLVNGKRLKDISDLPLDLAT